MGAASQQKIQGNINKTEKCEDSAARRKPFKNLIWVFFTPVL